MREKILQLVEELNAATAAYDAGTETLSDKEWDDKYFELVKLQAEENFYPENSPTQNIFFDIKNELVKVEHNHKMLSLDKTKDIEVIKNFLKNNNYLVMYKLDGLTCSLRYLDGKLISAETRGDGFVGEDILHNARVLNSIPQKINYKEELIVDGEVYCDLETFSKYFSEDYKNPRNFAAGGIRLLSSKECASRKLTFTAWEVIKGFDNLSLLSEKFEELKKLGFSVVPYKENELELPKENINYPIDGFVYKFNNIAYGRSLGSTDHHFKNAISMKFYDESYETKLLDIEWGMGRTGRITPIAIFEPVEIDGTIVEKASLHNLSVMEETLGKHPKVGQIVEVAKMNMIIPQIVNSDLSSGGGPELRPPKVCPICGKELTETVNENIRFLYCTNSECQGQLVNRLDHFCGKKGLDIRGLSKVTLEKLVGWGWINSLKDIFSLKEYRKEWVNKEGFGVASVDKILLAIEDAKKIKLDAFICSLGIPLIGKTVSRELVKHIKSYEDFRKKIDEKFDFSKFEGFAEVKSDNLLSFDYTEADELYSLLVIENPKNLKVASANINVVITGKLEHFKNRGELQSAIENAGGKVSSSISSKTDYLINNDLESQSSKNKKAKSLNIPIISEKDFISKFLTF